MPVNRETRNETTQEMAARSASMTALRTFRQPMIAYIQSGLEDNEKLVRIMAAEMLGLLGDPGSADSLKPLLADSDRDLRFVAGQALEAIRSRGTETPLHYADPCGNCTIRLVAEEALDRLKIFQETARTR